MPALGQVAERCSFLPGHAIMSTIVSITTWVMHWRHQDPYFDGESMMPASSLTFANCRNLGAQETPIVENVSFSVEAGRRFACM